MRKKERKRLIKLEEKFTDAVSQLNSSPKADGGIPKSLLLQENTPGFFFGKNRDSSEDFYVGKKQESDGHILVVGGSGSGKSSGIAMPTMYTWRGPMCVTDINGELSDHYRKLYEQGDVTRPYIRFDPDDFEGPSYDPLQLLIQDGEENLVSNVQELVLALLPVHPGDTQPFWAETERAVLEAAILYYFPLGLSFSEIIAQVMAMTMMELCTELAKSEDIRIKYLLGEMAEMKAKMIACVDRGLRNKLMLFATDPFISHALRGEREGAKYFSWEDLDDYNIFLSIPENRICQWGSMIILILRQLIQYLERRPNKHSEQGEYMDQILLLLDEFPRFGRLEMIADSITTLRNKKVTVSLLIQSLAQLDKIYGEHDRRIICENCQNKVILQACDAETQEYISRIIGTHFRSSYGCSQQFDSNSKCSGYNFQLNEVHEWMVQPHRLATLNDVLLLSPLGFFRVEKLSTCRESQEPIRFTTVGLEEWNAHLVRKQACKLKLNEKRNSGTKILGIEERVGNAKKKVMEAEEKAQEQRRAEKQAREKQEKRVRRNNYLIGEVAAQYVPAIIGFELEEAMESDGQLGFQTKEESQKQRVDNRKAREAEKKRVQSNNYAIGEVVAQYVPAIIGFEPEEDIESGDCLKILEQVLFELVKNAEFLQKLREKVIVGSSDNLVNLGAILAKLVNDPAFKKQLQKKAIDIVIIENFFNEIIAKNESESAEN